MRLNEQQMKEAREWCVCCWPDEADYIAEATPEQIEKVVERRYDGGLAEFIACNP